MLEEKRREEKRRVKKRRVKYTICIFYNEEKRKKF